jgi:single-stranded-DNA-specific exonuclease
MEKQWQILDPDPRTVRTLSDQLACHPLLARLLAIRGIRTKDQAHQFLNPSFAHLTPPLEMAGMAAAVERIGHALSAHETMIVFGDYDADGITATALLVEFLRKCHARVGYYIPHRMTDGYGMGVDFIDNRAKPAGIDLIITVDCGSGSGEAIAVAHEAGIHTIVTDHHPIDRPPEEAVAVINPSRSDCPAGLSHLAGVGVAFYLVIALRAHLRKTGFWQNRPEPNLKQLCDLVALGTVADMAPLIRENRTLTAAGLDQINRGIRPGIAALMQMSATPEQPADAETIAFRLAPRLNAAGRLVHARMACELLLAKESRKANRLAGALCRLNSRRQSMENDLLASILERFARIPTDLDRSVLVVSGNRWHEGILGIVAARLTRQFNRPAVVVSTRNGMAKGSARSVEGVDLPVALNDCADLLDRFGGHALAAGLSLPAANIDDFKSRLEKAVDRMTAGGDPAPPLCIDARLPLDEISPQLMKNIERLGPFGQGNPYPLFMDTDVRVRDWQTIGKRHRRLVLQSAAGNGVSHPAVQFDVAADSPTAMDRFEKIAYRQRWNYWKGNKKLQIVIEATRPAS